MWLVCDIGVKLRICEEILIFCILLMFGLDGKRLMNDLALSLTIFFVQLNFFPVVVLFHNRTGISETSIQCNFLQLLGLLSILMLLGALIQESRRDEGRHDAGL